MIMTAEMIERIFWLMTHPDASVKQYCIRWEVSRNTYYRDKRFVDDRLWNYKVIQVK